MEQKELDPWSLYIYAMKAPMTRDRYKTRLAKFLDFIGIEGEAGSRSLEDKARAFAKKSKADFNWAFANLLKFIQFHKERVDKKEITGATVRNYVKSLPSYHDYMTKDLTITIESRRGFCPPTCTKSIQEIIDEVRANEDSQR